MKANKHLAFSRVFVFLVIFLIAGGVSAQNVNTNTANSKANVTNRNTAAVNSNTVGNSTANNQTANNQTNQQNKITDDSTNSTNSTNSIPNTAGQTGNSNSSNSNTADQLSQPCPKIKYGDFEMACFPFWVNVVILAVFAITILVSFWYIPNKIKNMSGATVMKISLIFLFAIVLLIVAVFGFTARSTTGQTANTNTANQNSTNTAAANNSTADNQNGQPSKTPTPQPSETPSPKPSETPSPQPSETPVEGKTNPVVGKIYRLGYENNKEEGGQAGIRDIIVVEVKNLKKLVDRSLCLDDKGDPIASGCTKQKIALFLEGRKIDSIEPEAINLNGNDGTVQFHLTRSVGSNDEAWADLLGDPPIGKGFFSRENTKVSVGLENEYALAQPQPFNIIRIREWRFWIFTILYLFLLYLIYHLAVKSDILRDIGEQPEGSTSPEGFGIFRAFTRSKRDEKRKPYSLARFQMAFWFLLVIGSFFYIWLVTGALDIITTEILALIGIGAGTALGAAAIDVGKRETANTDVSAKEEERKKLETEIAGLETRIITSPPPPDLVALQSEHKEKAAKLAALTSDIERFKKGLRPVSEGFLKDVLTDATGVSFHRFQIFIWTLVLGVIFVISVWTRLSMPEFGATLLALLGISAGTYLGFKIPEPQDAGG